jgi:hypothetical protein
MINANLCAMNNTINADLSVMGTTADSVCYVTKPDSKIPRHAPQSEAREAVRTSEPLTSTSLFSGSMTTLDV